MLVTVEVLKNHLSMTAGQKREMSHLYANQLQKQGVVRVIHDGPMDTIDNKSMSATPHPAKARPMAGINNKAVGA